MKVRVYDSGKKFIDRYCMYFPYPKWLREEYKKAHGDLIMGYGIDFNFHDSEKGRGWMTRYCGCEDDRSLGYNLTNQKKVKIERLPMFVQEEVLRMQKVWNDALKYDDDEHWKLWNEA